MGWVWGQRPVGAGGEAEVPVDFRASPQTALHLMGLWTPHSGCPRVPMEMLEVIGSSCGVDGFTCAFPCIPGQM